MAALDWPQLLEHIRSDARVVVMKSKDGDEWETWQCVFANHAHDDTDSAMRVHKTNGGVRCFKCSFTGNLNDVARHLNISIFDDGADTQEPTPIRPRQASKLVHVYTYRDPATGEPVAEKARREYEDGRKLFLWRKYGVDDWPEDSGVKMDQTPLYNAHLLAARPDADVFFVEGEKACDACVEHGLLAVTNGGGGSQKEFGATLDVLRGRRVCLWADNDPTGAKLMNLLSAKLKGVAASIVMVSVPIQLPEKGDAFDYFQLGGTVEAIDAQDPNEPIVRVLDDDSVQVIRPSEIGPLTFTFTEMERVGRSLDASLELTFFQGGHAPYRERIDLLSSNQKTELRRDLDNIYDFSAKGFWTRVVHDVISLAVTAFQERDRGKDVFDLPDSTRELLLLDPLVVSDGVTIFYGDGSAGKSFITFSMALCAAWGEKFCDMTTPYLTPLVVDFEDTGANFKRRLRRLAKGFGMQDVMGVHYWEAGGASFRDQADAIRRYCTKHGIGMLIIDGAEAACAGSPVDDVVVLGLFRAIKKIGLPTVILAHVNRAGDVEKPYGNAAWHNEARRTWHVFRPDDVDRSDIDVMFTCKKVNDGRKPRPIAFKVSFADDNNGAVKVSTQNIERVPDLLARTSPQNQVWASLGGMPRTVNDIAADTGLDTKEIARILDKGPFERAGTMELDGPGRRPITWTRRAQSA